MRVAHVVAISLAIIIAFLAVGLSSTEIVATRKTTPGLRAMEKSAVIAGGGGPHRYGHMRP